MNEIKINNIKDLTDLIDRDELEPIQIIEIIEKSLNIFVRFESDKYSKQELIKEIKTFWNKYGLLPLADRPLFLDESNFDLTTLEQSPTAKQISDKLEEYY